MNFFLVLIFIFLLKTLGLIFPPFSGGIFTLGLIPFIGPLYAYLFDFIASAIGFSVTYLIAKKYGDNVLGKLIGEKRTEKIKNLNLKSHNQFFLVLTMSLVIGFFAAEIVSYVAGFYKFRYKNMITGTLIAHVAIQLPAFLLVEKALEGYYLAIIVLVLLVVFLYFFRKKAFSHFRW